MKPVAFEYCYPDTLEEALQLLVEFGEDGALISGGMSLGAMLNMRLVRPAAVIDINGLEELAKIEIKADKIRTGALVRQAIAMQSTELASTVPLLMQALPYVGHYQTRSRGTLGGSVAHADPSAEIPLSIVTLGGSISLSSLRGQREVAATDFFHGLLTTDRKNDEVITALSWPKTTAKTGFSFKEIAQRHGDFAIAAVAAKVTVSDDEKIKDLSLGLGGIEDRPFVADTSSFVGKVANPETANAIANAVADTVSPMVDLQANADYRRQLVRVLGTSALVAAMIDAKGQRGNV